MSIKVFVSAKNSPRDAPKLRGLPGNHWLSPSPDRYEQALLHLHHDLGRRLEEGDRPEEVVEWLRYKLERHFPPVVVREKLAAQIRGDDNGA